MGEAMKNRSANGSNWSKVAKKSAVASALMGFLAVAAMAQGGKDWPTAPPKSFAVDPEKLAAIDADLAAGKYGLVDSMLVLRCGTSVFDKTYKHDYGQIYGERAKTVGPLNHD